MHWQWNLLFHQRVKFSANVVPYYKINRNNNLFVQDYGIKRKGRLIIEELIKTISIRIRYMKNYRI